MPVSRLAHIPGIGVDEIGDAGDATGNPSLLRLENLDTDVPPATAREITHAPPCPPAAASQRLFTRAEIAATPMTGWGTSGERYLRLVFANEPIERLGDLRARFDAALA